jgi:hypothetical protein
MAELLCMRKPRRQLLYAVGPAAGVFLRTGVLFKTINNSRPDGMGNVGDVILFQADKSRACLGLDKAQGSGDCFELTGYEQYTATCIYSEQWLFADKISCDILYDINAFRGEDLVMAEKRLVKLAERILANPKEVGFHDLSRLLEGFGYECRQPKGGNSHYVFRKAGNLPISVPKNKPVNKHYVKSVIDLLDLEEWYEKNR